MITNLDRTTSTDISARLVQLREEGGVSALGRVLTLVVVAASGADAETAIDAANAASREHPCRVIVVVPADADGPAELSAEIRVGADAGASEVVVLHPRGGAGSELDTLIIPLLLPDAPVVVWWTGHPPAVPAEDPVGRMAQRRITDAVNCADPHAVVGRLAEAYAPGDTDLAWSRGTLWRGLLAAALDEPPYEPVLSAHVTGEGSRPSMELLAGWLAERLGCPVTTEPDGSGLITEVRLERARVPIVLRREPGTQVAVLSRPDRPDQQTNLPVRTLPDCLMEELRRLDPDEAYAHALTRGLPAVATRRLR